MSAPAGSLSAVHQDRAAIDVCARCGTFLCDGCVELVEEAVYCAPCRKRLAGLLGGSWLSIAAGITAFVGPGCAPFALVAIALAGTDLALVAAGRRPKGGRKLDLISLGVAVAGLALGALIAYRLMTGQVRQNDFN